MLLKKKYVVLVRGMTEAHERLNNIKKELSKLQVPLRHDSRLVASYINNTLEKQWDAARVAHVCAEFHYLYTCTNYAELLKMKIIDTLDKNAAEAEVRAMVIPNGFPKVWPWLTDEAVSAREARREQLEKKLKKYRLAVREDSSLCAAFINGTLEGDWTPSSVAKRMHEVNKLMTTTNYRSLARSSMRSGVDARSAYQAARRTVHIHSSRTREERTALLRAAFRRQGFWRLPESRGVEAFLDGTSRVADPDELAYSSSLMRFLNESTPYRTFLTKRVSVAAKQLSADTGECWSDCFNKARTAMEKDIRRDALAAVNYDRQHTVWPWKRRAARTLVRWWRNIHQ